ncbi:MAG TPA: HAD family hydrolase [Solirubrobacter sp.]
MSDWVTFDCYGTLIDWRTGMTEALEAVAPGRSAELIEGYHAVEPEIEAGPFKPYREVLAEGLERAAATLGIALGDYDVLGPSVPTWRAFADTVPMLERLRAAGWQLAILSNSDAAMLAGTLESALPVPFGEVVAADQVRSYKPAHGHFDAFAERQKPDRWVHTGCSRFHDVVPAQARGLEAILIDREGAGDDLGKLVEALT